MSTRSLIAIKQENGSVKSIYCHYDGYPEGVGSTLLDHYRTVEKVNELLELGPISCLGEHVAPLVEFEKHKNTGEMVKHSFDSPHDNVTVAYHRDRGEAYSPPKIWGNADEMLKNAFEEFWADYCYLFDSGNWFVADTSDSKDFKLVSEALGKTLNPQEKKMNEEVKNEKTESTEAASVEQENTEKTWDEQKYYEDVIIPKLKELVELCETRKIPHLFALIFSNDEEKSGACHIFNGHERSGIDRLGCASAVFDGENMLAGELKLDGKSAFAGLALAALLAGRQ